MNRVCSLLLVCLFPVLLAATHQEDGQEFQWISLGADAAAVANLGNQQGKNYLGDEVFHFDQIVLTRLQKRHLPALSELMHETFNRCPGFIAHTSKEEAMAYIEREKQAFQKAALSYSINNSSVVNTLKAGLDAQNIVDTISQLASYHNRYYSTQTGVDAALWIKGLWESYAAGRPDVSVALYNHSGWAQPSVVLTINGSSQPGEIVVLGGHLDSVNLSDRTGGRAPGADDNASGIAVLSEIIRVALGNDYSPSRTVKFVGYAGEESGLLGSGEIAQAHLDNGDNVVGVLQLDMTNFNGSNPDIVLITDNTNAAQNTFLGNLIDTYVNVGWATGTCGYACSDHASWHNRGFAASMPFEAFLGEHNSTIHTTGDTLSVSGNNATHAMKFARLGATYLAELAKGGLNGDPGPATPQTETFSGNVAKNEEHVFGPFSAEPGTTFEAVLSGSGNADLYVAFGQAPTTGNHDCASQGRKTTEACSLTVPTSGAAYVMVRGERRSSNYSLQVTHTPVASLGVAVTKVDLHSDQILFNQKRAMPVDELLGMGSLGAMVPTRAIRLKDGHTVTRYQQHFGGVPVFGGDISVKSNASGLTTAMHGTLFYGLSEDIFAAGSLLSEADAMILARKQGLAEGKSWSVENEQTQLFLFVDDQDNARQAYQVSFFATNAAGEMTRPFLIFDARSGHTLKQWEGLATNDVGTGPGGNGFTGAYEYGTDLPFLDVTVNGGTYTMENADIKTVNLNGGTSGSTAYTYSGPRNTYQTINGGFNPLNDAHYMGGVVVDMYRNLVSVPPLTSQMVLRVHYSSNAGSAFWNGTSVTFGDGNSNWYPLTVLDVVGHEASHGFTEQQSGLIYTDQSGGINEAFSDMAGETAEFFGTGNNDWLVGAEIYKSGSGALRYMDNPTADGISIDHAADYVIGMNNHYSSGVYNKAFYVLSQTAGWDITMAFKAFARANRLYWNATTDFDAGACGVIDAAGDLFYNTADVVAAFASVGVACGGTGPGPTCQPKNGPCTNNGDCCSGNCNGRRNKCK